jgi:uncharacterized protein YcbK (DUF882 family)
MLRVGLALLTLGLGSGIGAGAAHGGEEDGDEADTAAVTTESPPQAQALSSSPSRTSASRSPSAARSSRSSRSSAARRSRNRARAKVAGHVVPESKLRTEPLGPPSGNVHLYSLASHESLKVNIYNADGSYNVQALKEVSHMLRCKRTDAEKDIEPRLVAILSHVYDHFDGKRIEVVSGFRNQRRQSSYHYQGSASDIRIPGVKYTKVRAFVESLDAGGLGIGQYPRSGFVHVDVRPPPSYRWTDWSRSEPNAPDKRPPRGWKNSKTSKAAKAKRVS